MQLVGTGCTLRCTGLYFLFVINGDDLELSAVLDEYMLPSERIRLVHGVSIICERSVPADFIYKQTNES